MSGSTNEAGRAAGSVAGVATGATMLPYTGNNDAALIVALLALIAGTAVLTAVIIKRIIVKL